MIHQRLLLLFVQHLGNDLGPLCASSAAEQLTGSTLIYDIFFQKRAVVAHLDKRLPGVHHIGLVRNLAIVKLEQTGHRFVSVKERAHGHALRFAALKVHIYQRTLGLIALLGSKVVVDQTPRIDKRTVVQAPTARIATIHITGGRIVFDRRMHMVSTFEDMLILARTDKAARIDQQVYATQANGIACGIEQAVLDDDIARVETGDTIVSRLERARTDRDVVAVVDVQPVVTAQNAHALNKHVVARVDLMAPICTAHKGVALKRHIAAPADADTHGAAKALLPCRVGAIDAVKEAAGLAHDRNVLASATVSSARV